MLKTACGNGFPLNIPSEIPTGGGGGTGDYPDLTNKPKINNVTLLGEMYAADLGLASADIEDLIPSDASSSNQLVTANDLPGLATTSAPGTVQPDGTTITINGGVISAVGAGGDFTWERIDIDLSTVIWYGSGTGRFSDVLLTNKHPKIAQFVGGLTPIFTNGHSIAINLSYTNEAPFNGVFLVSDAELNSGTISLLIGY